MRGRGEEDKDREGGKGRGRKTQREERMEGGIVRKSERGRKIKERE